MTPLAPLTIAYRSLAGVITGAVFIYTSEAGATSYEGPGATVEKRFVGFGLA